jgi:hypothetical protein
MKMTVIADANGSVISTYSHPAQPGKNDPILQIHGGPGHAVHELDVPAELEQIKSVDELHRTVGEHLKKTSSKHR